ncbi:MAG: TonB-dependent receptor [Haliscomenobacter sp.]|nr:TonB-dependent receptor [Haliscomenobacter sp.]MBK7476286.1 TonB-dependent receptor [Haliscomenobacter sp.]
MKGNILLACLLIAGICSSTPGASQMATVKGKVTDLQSGEPLPLATIQLGAIGAVSELNGQFLLQLEAGTYRLTVSYVGYLPFSDTLQLANGQTWEKNIQLLPQSTILETATVTAGRYQKPVSEVTVSLEVLKPALIENSHRYQLDEALEKIPGVSIIDGQANIRGGSGFSYGAGSRVLLLVDDIPILQADAGFPNWNDIPIEHTGQIEVIKGASSALYGSAALNGVVNFRTAWPTTEPETKGAFFSGMALSPKDSRNQWWDSPPLTFGGSVSHKQKFNRLDLVAGVFYLNEESHNEKTFSRYGRLNFNTRYRLNDRLAFGVNGNLNKGNNQDFFFWKSEAEALSPFANTLAGSDILRFNIDPYLTYFDGGGNRHKVLGRYYRIDNQNSDQRGNTSAQYYTEYQFQRHFQDARLFLTAGAVASGSQVEAELYGDTTFNSRNQALYANLDKKIGNRLTLALGVRLEDNLLKNPGFSYPRGVVQPSRERESKPVLRIGLNYEILPFTHFRASWGQGYRYPSIAEKFIFTQFGGISISPSPALRSETGWSAETGLRQGLKVGAFEGFIDVSGFWIRYKDMMEFNFIDLQTGFRSTNIGETEVKGFEMSTGGQMKTGKLTLNLVGGYLYIDPTYQDFDATPLEPGETPSIGKLNAINSSSDKPVLKYRSPHSMKMDLEALLPKWSLGASVQFASFQEAVDRTLLFIIPGAMSFRNAHDKGYLVLDLRGSFQISPQIKCSMLWNNALNEAYILRPGLMEAPSSLALRLDWKL